MLTLSIRSTLRGIERKLDALSRKQLPFATATALTAMAKRVQAAEVDHLKHVLRHPKPFTLRSVGVKAARKTTLRAEVFVKDIAAAYLEPYEFGGKHKLAGRAFFNPKDIRLDAWGQIPRSMLARLKARPDVFIGAIKTHDGKTVNGVWQRPTDRKRVTLLNAKGKRLRGLHQFDASKARGKLKLLIRFGDALEVKQRLGYRKLARKMVGKTFAAEFDAAMAKAHATAR